jgi:AraC-like DNA-binding protein
MIISKVFRFGRVQYGPGTKLGPRGTVGYEFVRILKGQVKWIYDGVEQAVGPGWFILSQPGHTEQYIWDPQHLTQHDYVHFYLQEVPAELPDPSTWARFIEVDAQDILHGWFQYIIDLKRSGHPEMLMMIRQTVQQMLYAWALDVYHFTKGGLIDFSPPVQRVMDLVHSRWHRRVFGVPSLQEMVQRSGVSRSTFLRAFEAQCGDSPGRFFEGQRLHLAALHLLESSRSVSAIAEYLQYPNPFQLSRGFKQRFGVSPRGYRAQWPSASQAQESFVFKKVFGALSATQADLTIDRDL